MVSSKVRMAVRLGSLSYKDIVHAVQNTVDSCINSATDRLGYVLEHKFTKFTEIMQFKGHYTIVHVQRNNNTLLINVGGSLQTFHHGTIILVHVQ